MRGEKHEGGFRLEMKNLIRQLIAVAMLGIFTVGAFGQGRGRDNKRPPKDPGTVRSSDKRRDPPPRPPQDDKRPPKGDKKRP